jgi:hypothetical protein
MMPWSKQWRAWVVTKLGTIVEGKFDQEIKPC